MTENAKTITFVCVGMAAVVLAALTRPSSADLDVKSLVGEVLTKKFQSPDQAKRLAHRPRRRRHGHAATRFEVAEKNGLWTMPSKDGYPADATKQMAEAATALMDRKILEVASENAGDHEQYGVDRSASPSSEAGQKGVGTRVTISDAQDKPLVDMIVGKEVKDSKGKHYVRKAEPGRGLRHRSRSDAALDRSFEDWIEKDLLKLNTFDLQQVEIKDYSAELVPVMTTEGPRSRSLGTRARNHTRLHRKRLEVECNPLNGRYDKDKKDYVEFKLADDEELNTTALEWTENRPRRSKNRRVVQKPQGLSEDLKAGKDFLNNREAIKT